MTPLSTNDSITQGMKSDASTTELQSQVKIPSYSGALIEFFIGGFHNFVILPKIMTSAEISVDDFLKNDGFYRP